MTSKHSTDEPGDRIPASSASINVAIDRTAIRHLLTLAPEERLRLAASEARNLRRFDLAVRISKAR